jgi:hypothetical protein
VALPLLGRYARLHKGRQPVVALSLGGLRRKVEAAMLPEDCRLVG